jgi:hypothetical protein
MRVRPVVVAYVLALCALAVWGPLVVQSSTAAPAREVSSPTPVPTTRSSSEPQGETEAALLKAQLEVMRQYDQRLLQTVYWTLATAFGVTLFVAGAGWYVNFRLYDRDKQALLSELHSEVEAASGTSSRSIERGLQEARTSLDNAVSKMREDLHHKTEERGKQIEEAALQASKEAINSLQAQFKTMQNEMIEIRYNAVIREAKTWRAQGVHTNELRAYMEALSLAMQLLKAASFREWLVEEPLEGMQGALEAGAGPGAGEIAEISDLLDALPSRYTIQAERLRDLVRRSKPS